MKVINFGAGVAATTLLLALPAAVQAAAITGNVVFGLTGDFTARVIRPPQEGDVTTPIEGSPGTITPEACDAVGDAVCYEITLNGTGTLNNTLSSTTDPAVNGWTVSSEGSIFGEWLSVPSEIAGIVGDDGITVERSVSQTIPGPRSLADLGEMPVAPGGSVSYATALSLLQDFSGGGEFTFGGGQNILPAGDTIAGGIDFGTGIFNLTITGNDALASLVMQTNFLDSLGIAPSSTLTSFGAPEDWDRSILAFLPDSGTFSSTTTLSPLNADVAAVPVPASLPLVGAGLAMFGLLGWRKRRA